MLVVRSHPRARRRRVRSSRIGRCLGHSTALKTRGGGPGLASGLILQIHNGSVMRCAFVPALATVLVFSAVACESGSSTPSTTTTSYSGSFTGQMIVTTTSSTTTCLPTRTLNGTPRIALRQPTSGTTITGTADTTGSLAETAVSPAGFCAALPAAISLTGTRAVTGTSSSLVFTSVSTSTAPTAGGGTLTCTDTIGFS